MTSPQSAGDLSLLDEAVVRYHAKGFDFIELLDQYLNPRPHQKRYVYSSPECLILAEEDEDEEHGRFWRVVYAASRIKNPISYFFKLAPYKLDIVAFSRYRRMTTDKPDCNKFYSWDKLLKYSYGK
tara:strand:+ start:286 stop:663 length:378 start_codon:yes stop_codon:yes gene_type:complete